MLQSAGTFSYQVEKDDSVNILLQFPQINKVLSNFK